MEKITKIHLQNSMINKIIFLVTGFFSFIAQSQQVIFEDLNADKIKDTLSYKCYKVDSSLGISEPTCKCKVVTGKFNKKYNFSIFYISDITISSCGTGCISIFDTSKDTEYTNEYLYNKKYDNWILIKNETRYNYENGKAENNLPKNYLLGIDGKKYTFYRKKKK